MRQEPFEQQLDPALEAALDDGDEGLAGGLEGEALDELAALAEAEATAADAEQAAQAEELAAARLQVDAERAQTRAAVARYREGVLAAEPELPPELVSGETLQEVDGSLDSARRAVAQIRERLTVEEQSGSGFPAGAPARGGPTTAGMTAAEKIVAGLEQRAHAS